jgi:hypothetical protein
MGSTGVDTTVSAGLMDPPAGTNAPPMFFVAFENFYEEKEA